MRTGRIATAVMVLIALAWIPVIKGANSLYEYLQAVQGYLAPPIFVVFFFGVFFKRLNAKGCFVGDGRRLPPGRLPHAGRYAGHAEAGRLSRTATRPARSSGSSTTSTSSTSAC